MTEPAASHLVWHRRMLFGTISRPAMIFASAVRRKSTPPEHQGATKTNRHSDRDAMPYGWPRCDITNAVRSGEAVPEETVT